LSATGFADEELQALQLLDVNWRGHEAVVVRGDNPVLPTYELWIDANANAELQQAVAQAGAIEIREEALEMLRIASGIPKYGKDIRDRDLPQETAQDRALNFNKGCYIGQEIVERIRSRGAVHRMFTGFEVEGAIPSPGFRVQHEGKDVAELTSVAAIPARDGHRTVALGYGRKELMTPGRVYAAGETTLRVAGLPFTQLIHE
jgi:aminomethyltransferase